MRRVPLQLFGRSADDRPMKEAAEWRVLDGDGVQVVDDADRAGRSMITVNVDDIEALVTEMTARGLEAKAHCARPRPLASRAHHPIRMETF